MSIEDGEELILILERGDLSVEKLPKLLSGMDLNASLSRHFMLKWADKAWCDANGPQSHSYLTWIIACLVSSKIPDVSFLSSPVGRMLMDGVSLRLGHLDGQVIRMGTVIGQRLSNTNLGIDLSDDTFCKKVYDQIFQWTPPPKPEKPKVSNDDSDEVIPKPIEPPHFLSDLIECIISDDDWRKHQAVIDHLPAILKKSSSFELQDHGERIMRNLIFWQDRFKLDNFDDKLGDFLGLTMLKSPVLGRLIGSFVNNNDINDGRKVQILNSTIRAISIEKKSDLCLYILETLLIHSKNLNDLILEKILITSGVLIFNCKQSFDSEKMLKLYFDYLIELLPRMSPVYGLKRALFLSCSLIIKVPNSSLFIHRWSAIADFLQDTLSAHKNAIPLDEETRLLAIDLSQQILNRFLLPN